MKCPSCDTVINNTEQCPTCGADLSLFIKILAPQEIPPSSPLPPEPAIPVVFPSFDSDQTSVLQAPPEPPPRPSLAPAPADADPELFDQAFASLEGSSTARENFFSSTDLVLRERSEKVDVLFHLCDESLRDPEATEQYVELDTRAEVQPTISTELQASLAAVAAAAGPLAFSKARRAAKQLAKGQISEEDAYTAFREAPDIGMGTVLSAFFSDAVAAGGLLVVALRNLGATVPFGILSYETAAPDIFALSTFLLVLPLAVTGYRALFAATVRTTPGYLINGLRPITLSGGPPSRFSLVKRVLASFICTPFCLLSQTLRILDRATNTRIIVA
jgi:hypothetical protein